MSKSSAPITASPLSAPPRKIRRRADVSYEALTSIDFSGLLGVPSADIAPDDSGDDGQPVALPENEPYSPPPNDPVAWSFDPPFLSIKEAAVWLGVSPATIKRLLAKGALPFVRVGERRKIPFSVLPTYVICNRAGCALPPASPSVNSTAYDA